MATKKSQELNTYSVDQLRTMLQEERVHCLELRTQSVTASLKNVKEIRTARKMIARILTVLSVKANQ